MFCPDEMIVVPGGSWFSVLVAPPGAGPGRICAKVEACGWMLGLMETWEVAGRMTRWFWLRTEVSVGLTAGRCSCCCPWLTGMILMGPMGVADLAMLAVGAGAMAVALTGTVPLENDQSKRETDAHKPCLLLAMLRILTCGCM